MCDLFEEFLKFQTQATEPLQIAVSSRLPGGLKWHRIDNVWKATCKDYADGSTDLEIHYAPKRTWHIVTGSIVSLPIQSTTTIATSEKFKTEWRIRGVKENGIAYLPSGATSGIFTLDNCAGKKSRCYTLLFQKYEK